MLDSILQTHKIALEWSVGILFIVARAYGIVLGIGLFHSPADTGVTYARPSICPQTYFKLNPRQGQVRQRCVPSRQHFARDPCLDWFHCGGQIRVGPRVSIKARVPQDPFPTRII